MRLRSPVRHAAVENIFKLSQMIANLEYFYSVGKVIISSLRDISRQLVLQFYRTVYPLRGILIELDETALSIRKLLCSSSNGLKACLIMYRMQRTYKVCHRKVYSNQDQWRTFSWRISKRNYSTSDTSIIGQHKR